MKTYRDTRRQPGVIDNGQQDGTYSFESRRACSRVGCNEDGFIGHIRNRKPAATTSELPSQTVWRGD